jgi:flagellar motor switch protein FliN/FliY
MTAVTQSIVAGLLPRAAAAATGTLTAGEALVPGEAGADLSLLEATGQAVIAQFSGSATGDLVLIVDGALGAALQESPFGPLDLAAALAPTIEAIGTAIGPVVLGALQPTDVRVALRRAAGHADTGHVTLDGALGTRAAIAIGLEVPEQAAASHDFVPSADRLDLLRGVEMQATAELGRVRMTVNDLLSLRDGAVIELDRAAGAPADLFVNGRLIARGEVVVVDENYGLRITQVVSDDVAR